MRRRRDPGRRRSTLAALATIPVLFAACNGDDGADPMPPVATTTTLPAEPRPADGTLRIGALIPSGDAAIATLLTESLAGAIDAVNEAGGVLGREVEYVIEDEGDSLATASQALENLEADGVDAIVGPTSSNVAMGALGEAVADGLVTCSPTATAIGLDEYPDDDLFFRTIPTDSLQAVAIAQEAQSTGAGRLAIVHVDDAYGRPYAEAVAQEIGDSITVELIPVGVDDDDLDDEIDMVEDLAPQVLVILGSGVDTARFLEAIGQRDDMNVPNIIVNDDARRAASRQIVEALPASVRERILVLAPQITVRSDPPPAENPPFGPQVIDCVNLLALAAVQGQSDAPEIIAGQLPSVSDGGFNCVDYQSCLDLLTAGDDIDYDGPTGLTDIGRNGDPVRAFFERLEFAEDGSDIVLNRTAV